MVQIIENENFIKFADFSKVIWLLNRVSSEPLDDRVINIPEITESLLPNSLKFPKLMTEILRKYGEIDYEILTNDLEKFSIKNYVCNVRNVRICNY